MPSSSDTVVAPCLSDTPASDSASGFLSGRGTMVRTGLNGVHAHRDMFSKLLGRIKRLDGIMLNARYSSKYPSLVGNRTC